jgi:hypothetical protein
LFLLLFSLFFFPHFSLPFKTLNPKIWNPSEVHPKSCS